jgi:excisionase family DNA binding protein
VSERVAYKLIEAAQAVGVSPKLIRQAIHSTGGPGQVPHLEASMVGRSYLILRSDLEAWVKEQRS